MYKRQPPATLLAEGLIGIPFLLGFVRDGLAVSGRLDPLHPRYQRLKALASRVAGTWLPLVLRAALLAAAGLRIASMAASSAAARTGGGTLQPVHILQGGPLPFDLLQAALGRSGLLPWLLCASAASVQLLALLALIAGRAVPPAALLFLLLTGLRAFLTGLDLAAGLAIGSALLLLLFGPGPRLLTAAPLGRFRAGSSPPRS